MKDCLKIINQAGFFNKCLYENGELEVLEKVNNSKDINYSLYEECNKEQSEYFVKLKEVIETYSKLKEGKKCDDLLILGWLNALLNKNYRGRQKELFEDKWDNSFLSIEYTMLSIIETYCLTHSFREFCTFFKDVSYDLFCQLEGIEKLIEAYQSKEKTCQYDLLKGILIDLFSQQFQQRNIRRKELVFEIMNQCIETQSFILPFAFLCHFYHRDFINEFKQIDNEIDCYKLREDVEIIPHVSTKDFFHLKMNKVFYFYEGNLEDLPQGIQEYFNNLKKEFFKLKDQRMNRDEIIDLFIRINKEYHLYPFKEFIDSLDENKSNLMNLLKQVFDDCHHQKYGKETIEITLSMIMNQKLRLAVFGF